MTADLAYNKFFIDTTGNVGVGTTAPVTKLHVYSSVGIGAIRNTVDGGYSGVEAFTYNGSGSSHPYFMGLAAKGTSTAPTYPLNGDVLSSFIARDAIDGFVPITFGGASMYMNATENYSALNKGTNIRFSTTANGTNTVVERMRIDQNGNVGIGTTAPVYKLDVDNSFRIKTTSLNSRIEMRGGSDGTNSSSIYLYNPSNQLNTVLSDGTYNSYFNVFGGNVGIGTTTPSAKLEINGGAPLKVIGPNGRLIFDIGAMDAGMSGIAIGYGTTYNGFAMTNSGFIQAETQGGGFRNLLLNPLGGNVGIGTITPSHVFEVRNPALNPQLQVGTTSLLSNRGSILFGRSALWEVGSDIFVSNSDDFFIVQASTGQYAVTIDVSRNVGINTTAPSFKLDVVGTANCSSNTWTSDRRKKQNIQPLILTGLDVINKLKPVTFEWIKVEDDGMKGTQMGFIAQELEEVLPSMVVTANNDEQSKAVKYNELLPVLVKAIQELSTQNKELLKRIEVLEKK